MARPQAPILLSKQLESGSISQILKADNYYIITYQGRPVNLRTIAQDIAGSIRYRKTGYTNFGNCLAAVHQLNQEFDTKDFSYIKIGD